MSRRGFRILGCGFSGDVAEAGMGEGVVLEGGDEIPRDWIDELGLKGVGFTY